MRTSISSSCPPRWPTTGPPSRRRRSAPKGAEPWTVELEPTEDVVKTLAARRENGQVIVAFGAERGEAASSGSARCSRTRTSTSSSTTMCRRTDIGFDAKDNEVVLITREGEKRIAKAPKSRIAAAVLDEAVALLNATGR